MTRRVVYGTTVRQALAAAIVVAIEKAGGDRAHLEVDLGTMIATVDCGDERFIVSAHELPKRPHDRSGRRIVPIMGDPPPGRSALDQRHAAPRLSIVATA